MTDTERVAVIAVVHPLPGRVDDAISAVGAAIPAILAEDGCEGYAPHRSDDGEIVLLELWSSRAALAAHSVGPAAGALRSGLVGLLSAPTTVTVASPLQVGPRSNA